MPEFAVVISAAGAGRRMKARGPKALIEIGGGETVLSRQLLLARKALPKAEIIVVVGYQKDRVVKSLPKDVGWVENPDHEETNVARSLLVGVNHANAKKAVLMCGDLVFGPDFLACLPEEGSVAIIDENQNHRSSEVGCNIDQERVCHFSYGVWPKWGQAVQLADKELDLYRRVASRDQSARWFAYEVLNGVIDAHGVLSPAYPDKNHLVEIDNTQDIDRAKSLTSRLRRKGVTA